MNELNPNEQELPLRKLTFAEIWKKPLLILVVSTVLAIAFVAVFWRDFSAYVSVSVGHLNRRFIVRTTRFPPNTAAFGIETVRYMP